MNLNFLPELLSLFLFSVALYLGWNERKHFHSLVPFITAIVFYIVARLCDVAIQLPPSVHFFTFGFDHQQLITWLGAMSDVTDMLGVLFLVLGFVRTLKFQREEKQRIAELESLLPICAWCKKIRTEDGSWKSMEIYLMEEEHQQLTHGICPSCARNFHRETLDEPKAKGR